MCCLTGYDTTGASYLPFPFHSSQVPSIQFKVTRNSKRWSQGLCKSCRTCSTGSTTQGNLRTPPLVSEKFLHHLKSRCGVCLHIVNGSQHPKALTCSHTEHAISTADKYFMLNHVLAVSGWLVQLHAASSITSL